MPVHDWTRVRANRFHDFHQRWTVAICNALNAGRLPAGYFAMVEQQAGGPEPDVITLALKPPANPASPGGLAVNLHPPKVRHVLRSEAAIYARKANRITVRHPDGDVVAVIEVVSPGTTDSRHAVRAFARKAVTLLHAGVHLLIVDLFPPGPRDPQGMHKVIWDRLREEEFTLPPDKPLTLAAYTAGTEMVGYVEPVAVGDVLPDMPVFLTAGEYVPCPLETTYPSGSTHRPTRGIIGGRAGARRVPEGPSMPVHDWSRVDANVFHHFHQRWTIAICDALNAGLLPEGYSALVEQHAMGLVPDVLALERRRKKPQSEAPRGTLTVTPPHTRHVARTKVLLAARGNRVAIRHRLGELVCVIEVVSPGNKGSRSALRAFVAKSVEFLTHGVHLLVIDVLPPTPRDPHGIHKAIWDELEEEPFEVPPDKPLILAAYEAGDLAAGIETTAYVESIGVGDLLPDMPAYLEHGGYVAVPLEGSYQAAWATCPAAMRELVETGKLADEEE